MRLELEEKINGIHSQYVDLQAKYERSVNDIERLEKSSKWFEEKYNLLNTECIKLRSTKIKSESEIHYLKEKIASLTVEYDYKTEAYDKLE